MKKITKSLFLVQNKANNNCVLSLFLSLKFFNFKYLAFVNNHIVNNFKLTINFTIFNY